MASSTRSADNLIRYVLEPKKDQRGERYVMASGTGGLLVSLAVDQMRDMRVKWGRDKAGAHVQAYHVIQSFSSIEELDPDDPGDWMIAQRLGRALADQVFRGRQVLVVTQRDGAGGCLHNHIVAASIATSTGAALDSSVVMHARLVETHEAVLEHEGFEQVDALKQAYTDALDRRDRGELSGLRRALPTDQRVLLEATRHAQWLAEQATGASGTKHRVEPFSTLVLKERIDRALAAKTTVDWSSLVRAGQNLGVEIVRAPGEDADLSFGMSRRRSDSSFRAPTARDRRRSSTLGSKYSPAALAPRLKANAEAATRSVRAPSFMLDQEFEREVEAQMSSHWERFFQDRAASRLESAPHRIRHQTDVDSAAGAERTADTAIVAANPASRSADHIDHSILSESTSPMSLPAPAPAGAIVTSKEPSARIVAPPNPDGARPPTAPQADEAISSTAEEELRARRTTERRLHQLRHLAAPEVESLDKADEDHERGL